MQKILIVEDDTNINNLLQEALSKVGYSCEQAFSGTEAKLLLNMQEHGYELVLLDLMLPGIPGEAVLEEIRKKGNLPVIVLTAKDSLDEKVEVLTSGADDYITKPFEIREVLARVQVQLRRKEEKELKIRNRIPGGYTSAVYPLTVYQGGFYETVFHSDFMLCDAAGPDRLRRQNGQRGYKQAGHLA